MIPEYILAKGIGVVISGAVCSIPPLKFYIMISRNTGGNEYPSTMITLIHVNERLMMLN